MVMDDEYIQDYAWAKADRFGLSEEAEIRAHPWSFLTFLHEELSVQPESGLEMGVTGAYPSKANQIDVGPSTGGLISRC